MHVSKIQIVIQCYWEKESFLIFVKDLLILLYAVAALCVQLSKKEESSWSASDNLIFQTLFKSLMVKLDHLQKK